MYKKSKVKLSFSSSFISLSVILCTLSCAKASKNSFYTMIIYCCQQYEHYYQDIFSSYFSRLPSMSTYGKTSSINQLLVSLTSIKLEIIKNLHQKIFSERTDSTTFSLSLCPYKYGWQGIK